LPARLPDQPTSSPAQLAGALLESDAAYFEAGARIESLPGAVLAWMEGLELLSAAGVIARVDPGLGGHAPAEWLAVAESAVRQAGRSEIRVYLTRHVPELESRLRARGYRSRTEWGMLRLVPAPELQASRRSVVLHPVVSAADWQAKAALHGALERGPDDHPAAGSAWVELERRKVEAGYMRPYLARCDGEVCGAFALSRHQSLFRLKNLVLHPDRRRRGIGAAVMGELIEMVASAGGRALGAFAVERSQGERLYRKHGFVAITAQTEWIRRA